MVEKKKNPKVSYILTFGDPGNLSVTFARGELNNVRFTVEKMQLSNVHISECKKSDMLTYKHIPIITCEPAPDTWEFIKPAKDPKGNKWYNLNNLRHMSRAISHYRALYKHGISLHVTISTGNDKIGRVKNVSLLPYLTCSPICVGSCAGDCYAGKLAAIYGSTLNAWAKNTFLAIEHSNIYWSDVNKAITRRTKHFRFHVSGDILNEYYAAQMLLCCKTHPWCNFWTYTKKYSVVNSMYIAFQETENLNVLFSGWQELKPDNPYSFSETDIFIDETDKPNNGYICPGDCTVCIKGNTGCTNKKIKIVFFKLH